MRSAGKLADAILITAGCSSLLFLLFNISRHGWTLHYLSLLLVAAIFFSALRLSVSIKGNVALLLLSTVVGLYGAEALLGQVLFTPSRFSAWDWLNFPEDVTTGIAIDRIKEQKAVNASFDSRTRLQVVQDLRSQGIHAFPHIFLSVLMQADGKGGITTLFKTGQEEFLPLASISHVTTVFCNESGEYIIYDSDEHGFHNPPGLWQQDAVQVVALGDSFTHGACVPTENSFVSVIRSHFPATINLGVDGNGPLAMLATLKEYAASLRPKIVLWFYYEGNDSRDLDEREKNSLLLRQYLGTSFSQRLIDRQEEIDHVLTAYLEGAMQAREASFDPEAFLKLQHVRTSVQSVINKRPARDGLPAELVEFLKTAGAESAKEDLELFRAILGEARASVAAWGGRLYFVYLPTWARYRSPDLASQDRAAVLRIAGESGVPIVDIHTAFASHPDPLSLFPFRRHAHYHITGHQLVAEEVLKRLEKDGTGHR